MSETTAKELKEKLFYKKENGRHATAFSIAVIYLQKRKRHRCIKCRRA